MIKGMGRAVWLFVVLLLMSVVLCGSALADIGLIVSPGGDVKMRRKGSEKSGIVTYLARETVVEVLETGEKWTQVRSGAQTGYVRNDFILTASAMSGKTLYAESGSILLRKEPDEAAPVSGAVGAYTPVTVLSPGDTYSMVSTGKAVGWMPTEALLHQLETPSAEPVWIERTGYVTTEQPLLTAYTGDGTELRKLRHGEPVTVTVVSDDYCLVQANDDWGWTPVSGIRLIISVDTETIPAGNVEACLDEMKKNYKRLAKLEYALAFSDMEGPAPAGFVLVSCVDYGGCPMYSALLDPQGKIVLMSDETAFSDRPVKAEPQTVPVGTLTVKASADTLRVGEVLDAEISVWSGAECKYRLTRNGELCFTAEGCHSTVSYRPREEGSYRLVIRAADADGNTAESTIDFTVAGTRTGDPAEKVYSQKDGWWADRPYGESDLQQSGCAIFTLAHALDRMGRTGDEILPAALAEQYANCLTVDGTSNIKLIRAAAKRFSFSTEEDLIEDRNRIKKLLKSGAMFTFSVARGHIALIDGISADGKMVHIVDSAPGATSERLSEKYDMYYEAPLGGYLAAETVDEIPGARWFMETGEYGGLEYWLPLNYAANRGVRMIKPKQTGK